MATLDELIKLDDRKIRPVLLASRDVRREEPRKMSCTPKGTCGWLSKQRGQKAGLKSRYIAATLAMVRLQSLHLQPAVPEPGSAGCKRRAVGCWRLSNAATWSKVSRCCHGDG